MAESLSLSKVFNVQPGWYRGDFHAHTIFSDGVHSPDELVEVARAEGLDFITVTDHNTINAFPKFGEQREVLVIPGMEVTFRNGHFNVFGIEGWADWMEGFVHERDIGERPGRAPSDILRQTSALGLLNSLDHPLLKPWEWSDGAADMGDVHCVEVWNDPSWPDNLEANPKALELWTKWLNAGCRVTAIGGSDYHRPVPKPGEDKPAERLGLPSTYVFADELSSQAILIALRGGRAYVSLGPQLSFELHTNEEQYGIGAQLESSDDPLLFVASISEVPSEARARLIRNGKTLTEVGISQGHSDLKFEVPPAEQGSSWYRLDLYDSDEAILAFTNPIFISWVRNPDCGSYGDILPL